MRNPIGQKIGNVTIEALIGKGGMGAVYRGYDERLERLVAVKTLWPSSRLHHNMRARFLQEARILSRLDHPNICRIYDMVEHGDEAFLMLELIDGCRLSKSILGATLDSAARLEIAMAVVEAVAAAHREKIVHRDLKPDNIMLTTDGAIKVLDFGISMALDRDQEEVEAHGPARPDSGPDTTTWAGGGLPPPDEFFHTAPGRLMGTVAYMSPEQARGQPIDATSDMFSLGIVLQELFTGQKVYEPGDDLLERVAKGQARSIDGIAPDLVRLIGDLTLLEPSQRPDAEQTLSRLREIVAAPQKRRQRFWRWSAAILVTLAVTATAVVTRHVSAPAPLIHEDQRGRVLVLPFVNDTGDDRLNWIELGLAEMTSVALNRVDGVEVVPLEITRKAIVDWDLDLRRQDIEAGLDGLVRSVDAEIAVAVRVSLDGERYVFDYTTRDLNGSIGQHRVVDVDPTTAANTVAERLTRRLRPESGPVDIRDVFSNDSMVNRIYATGIQTLELEGPKPALAYFEVCLHQDPGFSLARLRLATALEETGDRDRARELASQVRDDARSSGLSDVELETLVLQADMEVSEGHGDRGFELFDKALALGRQIEDERLYPKALRSKGNALVEVGRADEAIDVFEEALARYRQLSDPRGEAETLNSLGRIAVHEGDFVVAEAYLLPAWEMAVALKDHQLSAVIDLNLAGIDAYTGRIAEARVRYTRLVTRAERIGDVERGLVARINLALCEDRLGRPQEARHQFELAFVEAHEHGLTVVEAQACIALCGHLVRGDQASDAERFLERVRSLETMWRDHPSATLLEALIAHQNGRFIEAAKLASSVQDMPSFAEYFTVLEEARRTGVRQELPDSHPPTVDSGVGAADLLNSTEEE